MPDDLSKLTPTDPSAVDPDWDSKREGILDGVLADGSPRRSRPWRWVAGAAAALLFVGAIGVVGQQLRHDQAATPASPSTGPGDPVELMGHLMEVGDTMGICFGGVLTSAQSDPDMIFPVRCEWGFVPVAGVEMPGFDDRDGTLVGSYDGSVFHATRWYADDELLPYDPEIDGPLPSEAIPPEPADLCEEQNGTGSTDFDDLQDTIEALPGYQASWTVTDEEVREQWVKEQGFGDSWSVYGPIPGDSYRIAVAHGAEAAQQALLEKFDVPLCVGTLPGPDAATVHDAAVAVHALFPPAPSELVPSINARETMDETGPGLYVQVLDATTEFKAAIQEAVGPEVWPSTEIWSELRPVDPAAPKRRVKDPVPMPSGPGTPLTVTDEDRGWAEESIATDLLDADGTSATASMAKATFAQFEALWSVDWEYDLVIPVTPPAGDTEVLVVTLSAPLSLNLPGDAPDAEPTTATGTLNLINAGTGVSILHVSMSGGPRADRLTEFPRPVEDVALPEGFR